MTTFFAYLEQLTLWHWFGLAAILAILDVMIGANFFLMGSGLVAALVGVLVWLVPTLTWEYQFLMFGVAILMSVIASRRWLLTRKPTAKPFLNNRIQQTIGRMTLLVQPIIGGTGKVKIDDTYWTVQGKDMPVGTKVVVTQAQGSILLVESCD